MLDRTRQPIPRVRLKDPAPPRIRKISPTALAMSKFKRRKTLDTPAVSAEQIFRVASPPPGVLPKGTKLAQDTNISNMLNWAATSMSSAFAEGVIWLGYPYLSELAQRPEYRRITETIATEMTRKWIKLQSKSTTDDESKTKRIKELTDYLEHLKVRDVFREVANHDGFFGRGHIFIDLGNTDDRDELRMPIGNGTPEQMRLSKEKVPRDGLKGFRAVEPVWCYPTRYDSINPLKSTWYNPDTWFVMGMEVSSSRLLRFVGREVPDLLKPAYSFGGLSLSQMAKPYIDNWLRTRQSVSDLISSFAVFVLMTELMSSMQPGGEELFERLELFNNTRDNAGVMALDKATEDFKNVSTPLSGLDTLQAQSQEHICSVSGIPLVKYTGISPHGLNASSEGEIRVFYDWIHSYQELLFSDHLWTVIRLAQLSLWGEVDTDITFIFEPLWELDEKSLAELRKTEGETAVQYIESGVISQEEHRKAIASDPDSPWQGLDPEDVPDLKMEEMGGLVPEGGGRAIAELVGGQQPQPQEGDDTNVIRIRDWYAAKRKYRLGQLINATPEELQQVGASLGLQLPNNQVIDDEVDEGTPPDPYRRFHSLGDLLNSPDDAIAKLTKLVALAARGGHDPNSRHARLARLLAPRGTQNDAELSRYSKLGKLLAERDATDTDESSRFAKLAKLLVHTVNETDPNSRFSKFAKLIGGGEGSDPFEPREYPGDYWASDMSLDEANFEEGKHPRDSDGKFTSGGGSSGGEGVTSLGKKSLHDADNWNDVNPETKIAAQNMWKALGGSVKHWDDGGPEFKLKWSKEADITPEGELGGSVPDDDYEEDPDFGPSATGGKVVLKMDQMKKVGNQMGSNPGGVYEDLVLGGKYYVKKGETEDHVKNELLAGKLYQLAGTPTLNYVDVEDGQHIATEMATIDKDANSFSLTDSDEAKQDFAVHAWLSNWDAVGLTGDNLGMVDGKPTALDLGGALAYRAQGSPKGDAFGTSVTEWDTLRDASKNEVSAKIFGDMTDEQLAIAAKKVTDIPNSVISKMVYNFYPDAKGDDLIAKLIKRKEDIADRVKKLTYGKKEEPKGHGHGEAPVPYKNPTKKTHIVHNLLGKGTTAAEVLKETGWPSVSMPAMAKAAGLELVKVKEGGTTKYYGIKPGTSGGAKQEAKSAPGSMQNAIETFKAANKKEEEAKKPKATQAELDKAKKGTPVPVNNPHPEAGKLTKEFNDKYAGKTIADPDELEKKVAAYKELQEKISKLPPYTPPAPVEKEWNPAALYMNHAENQIASLKKKGHVPENMEVKDVAAIKAYCGNAYETVNEQLRQGKISATTVQYMKNLNGALKKLPKHASVTYRKADLPSDVAAKYVPGYIVEERGFTSTAKNPNVWHGQYRYTIHGKTGRNVEPMSQHGSAEAEVIFPSGRFFKVTARDGNHITMEEIDPIHMHD